MENSKYIQGATLHKEGGVELGMNGRFIQVAMGEGRMIESSYLPHDALKIARELERLANAEISRLAKSGRSA